MTAFMPEPGTLRSRHPESQGRPRHPALWLRNIVRLGSLCDGASSRATALPCRAEHCPGRLTVERHRDGRTILWRCGRCGEDGSLVGWQGRPEDLTQVPSPPVEDPVRCLSLDLRTYEALTTLSFLDPECLRILFTAELRHPGQVLLSGAQEDLARLGECLHLEATLAGTEARRLQLLGAETTWIQRLDGTAV